jgi:peroxiredoxin
VYENLTEDLKTSNQGIEIKKYIALPEPPKVGDLAPEIMQLTPNGDTVRLSDFRGKYVLVDFWDSYCAPCRGSHKWLRRIYEKYNSKGFEILGVSCDKNKNRWVTAIKQDSITWTNISDLKGWQNEAFLIYDIKFIPQNYLVNPDGKIIKYRLCSESYADHELGQIFKNKKNSL